jgi:hypothetical protein
MQRTRFFFEFLDKIKSLVFNLAYNAIQLVRFGFGLSAARCLNSVQ